jgi:hypothetical protein
LAWQVAYSVISTLAERNTSYDWLDTNRKSSFIKFAVVAKKTKELRDLSSFLYTVPFPPAFSLANSLRGLTDRDPVLCLTIFLRYADQGELQKGCLWTSRCFGYAMQAWTSLVLCQEASLLPQDLKVAIPELLRRAASSQLLSVGLVSTALSCCRKLDDWQGAIESFSILKNLVSKSPRKSVIRQAMVISNNKRKAATNTAAKNSNFFEDGIIPDIIYGQTLSLLASEGAEVPAYQLLCETLEEGIRLTESTVNAVVLGLAKGGSHFVLIRIRDLLHSYGVALSNMAQNAILNAFDKASAYEGSLSYYFFKMTPGSIDSLVNYF